LFLIYTVELVDRYEIGRNAKLLLTLQSSNAESFHAVVNYKVIALGVLDLDFGSGASLGWILIMEQRKLANYTLFLLDYIQITIYKVATNAAKWWP